MTPNEEILQLLREIAVSTNAFREPNQDQRNRPRDRPTKSMEIGKWQLPRTKSKLVVCRPYKGAGCTLYAKLANWREHKESDPDYPPLFNREPLIIRRAVGNSVSIDQCDFSIRGYRFHADLDEAEISISRNAAEMGTEPSADEWEYFIESGYYDGLPLDVYQLINLAPYDYEAGETDTVHRYMKLYDYTREFRARGWRIEEGLADGQLLFYSAGGTPGANPITDPLAFLLEVVPVTAVQDWTPLNPWARYVAWAPNDEDEDFAIVEVRG